MAGLAVQAGWLRQAGSFLSARSVAVTFLFARSVAVLPYLLRKQVRTPQVQALFGEFLYILM